VIADTPKDGEDANAKVEYSPAIVSYIDLLGMKQLLDDAGDDASIVASVLNTFRRFTSPTDDTRDVWKWSFVNFSDLVVRIVPVLTDANVKYRMGLIFHEIMDLCFLQANLIDRNVLIRGAVTIGFINVDDGLIFGPALVQAHLLESKRSVYPRIIVDPEVIEQLKKSPMLRAHDEFEEEMSYLESILQKDEDGELFLNYLNWLTENADDHDQHMQFLSVHKGYIEGSVQKLQAQDLDAAERDKRAAKLAWLCKLHNAHVRSLNPEAVKAETGVIRDTLLTDACDGL